VRGGKLQIEQGEQVLIKSWKEGAPADQLQPKWKSPYPVTLTTRMAVKVQRSDSWTHLFRVKCATEEPASDKHRPGILVL
jgi:hypothetical protein